MSKIFTSFKCFLAATLLLASGSALATEVTFTPDGTYPRSTYSNGTEFSDQQGAVTMTVSNGSEESSQYRIYKGQTATFTAEGANIVAIVFTCTANDDAQYGPGCFTASEGDYTFNGKEGTWTGSASSVTFTASTNQVRATSIVVTLDDGTSVYVKAPSITPSTGTYTEAQTVSITAAEGTTAYYALNGGDYQAYSAPFQVSETTTVSAYAQDADGNKSSTVTSEITIVEAANWQSIAEVIAAATADGVFGTFHVSEATVVYVSGYNTYLTDGSRGLLIYGNSGLTAGDKVTGSITGSAVIYSSGKGSTELSINNVDGAEVSLTTVSSNNTVSAKVMDVADITTGDARQFESQYVALEGVKFLSTTWDDNSYRRDTIAQGDDQIIFYNQFKLDLSGLNLSTEKSYDVKGIVSVYNNVAQLYIINVNDVVESGSSVINGLKADDSRSNAIYTIAGQKVSNVTRGGLYIEGGKKVYVK